LFWDNRIGVFPWDGGQVANNPTQFNVGNVAQFHTYRLEWTATQMQWLIDGNVAKTQNITPANMEEFQKPFHIIMNLALAGAFPGTQPNQADFPLSMNVDYVRVYQAGGSNPTATFTPTATQQSSGNRTLYVRSGGALSTTAGTSASTVAVASAGGTNHDGTPTNPQTFVLTGVNGTYKSGNTLFHLYLDSGTAVGNGVQVRVSYDFTNNGSFDRVETYHYFATDPVSGNEDYNHTSFGGLASSSGSYANLSNGKVQIQVWSAIGNAATNLRVNASAGNGQQSVIQIPFN
ncbi:MAG TPA: family 16 glycosylhydrolase, partial [Phototrophicaceae bacterium]|nr:family 16 glycosylhydrolase [Phototrophicaceae bacterium]